MQVLNSLAYAEMKKMNAAKLEEKRIEELKAEVRADIHPVWLKWYRIPADISSR